MKYKFEYVKQIALRATVWMTFVSTAWRYITTIKIKYVKSYGKYIINCNKFGNKSVFCWIQNAGYRMFFGECNNRDLSAEQSKLSITVSLRLGNFRWNLLYWRGASRVMLRSSTTVILIEPPRHCNYPLDDKKGLTSGCYNMTLLRL